MNKQEEKHTVFRRWAEATTAHGFADFAQAKSLCGKSIWFFLIFISLLLMSYQLSRIIGEFAEHQWSSTIQETLPDSGGIEFPSIIICNVNRIKWSKAEKYNLTTDMISSIFFSLTIHNQYIISNANYSAMDQYVEWRRAHNFSFLDVFENLGPDIEDTFIQRTFRSQYKITPFFTIEYGRCWRVDFNYSSTVVGTKGGKTMILDSQVWDYLPLLYNNHLYEGLVIQIAYNGRVELGQWITLQPGTRTAIAMQAYEDSINQDEPSFRNPFSLLRSKPPCISHPTMKFVDKSQYSVINCRTDCNFLRTYRACKCIPYIRMKQYRTCEAEEILNCYGYKEFPSFLLPRGENRSGPVTFGDLVDLSSKGFTSTPEEVQAEVNACLSTCEKQCEDRYLQSQVYVTKAPTERQVDQLREYVHASGYLYNVRTQDFIILEIYFSTLVTKTVQLYEVMSLENLVSSSGGLIGLWAGMSFLTVFQAISYFLRYVQGLSHHKFLTRSQKRRQKNATPTSRMTI